MGHAFSFHGLDAASGPVFYCTLELAKVHWTELPKHGIKHVARHFNWKLDHHNPESDARICSAIVEEVAKEQGTHAWDALVTSNQWTAHHIPQYQGHIKIAAKPTGPRKRADYAHELIAWKPTVPLEQMAPGQRFILSGFDHAAKSKLREAGIRKGLHTNGTSREGLTSWSRMPKWGFRSTRRAWKSKSPSCQRRSTKRH